MKKLMMILKGERPPVDIIHYIVGNIRYKLYYSLKWKKLLKPHIIEQIGFRIEVMDKKCYEQGECKICRCQTTHLQMANKSCDKPCYPEMMTKEDWDAFYNKGFIYKQGNFVFMYNKKLHLYKILKEENNLYVQVN